MPSGAVQRGREGKHFAEAKESNLSALLSGCYGLGHKVKMVLKKGIIVDEEKTNRETKRLKCLIRTADAADAAAAVFSQSDSL